MVFALASLYELLSCAHVVAIPTRTRFRGISVREAVVFDSPRGASEFSPFTEYDDAEASNWLAAAIEFGWGEVAELKQRWIPVNATIPAVSAAEVPSVLDRFPGCRTAKVKVAEPGQSLADDIARVRATREALGPNARVRIDANGGWSVDDAEVAIRALVECELDYVEQPCAEVAELTELRARLRGGSNPIDVRIAADESVRKASDPLAVARAGAADVLVIKAQPLGGIAAARKIVGEAGLPVVVSSALDTSVGISMGLHLAATLPDGLLDGACGLATVALLEGDVTADPLLPVNGELGVRRPVLDAGLLRRYAAAPERDTWWRDRITRCYEMLQRAARP